jgi:hypothetical protein
LVDCGLVLDPPLELLLEQPDAAGKTVAKESASAIALRLTIMSFPLRQIRYHCDHG